MYIFNIKQFSQLLTCNFLFKNHGEFDENNKGIFDVGGGVLSVTDGRIISIKIRYRTINKMIALLMMVSYLRMMMMVR